MALCFIPITFLQRSISPSSIALISARPAVVKGCITQEGRETHESLNGYCGTSRPPDSLSTAPSARELAFPMAQACTHPCRTTTPPDHSSSNTPVPPLLRHIPKSGLPFSRRPLLKSHAQNRSGISTLHPSSTGVYGERRERRYPVQKTTMSASRKVLSTNAKPVEVKWEIEEPCLILMSPLMMCLLAPVSSHPSQ